MRSAIYSGHVMHARMEPVRNTFRYGVYQLLLDLDELPEIVRRVRLLGHNRRHVCEVRDSDHLGDPGCGLRQNVVHFLDRHGIDLDGGRIELLTNARVLGYVFNPVSFYWCRRRDDTVACVIAEVHNTFGEEWCYLLEPEGDGAFSASTAKRFHVSPFMGVEGSYRFRIHEPGERLFVRIDGVRDGRDHFCAVLTGARRELTTTELARHLVRYPLITAQVVGRIHLQALRLWGKRVPFHRKPAFDAARGSAAG